VVISVDVQLQASVDANTKASFLDSGNKAQTIICAPFLLFIYHNGMSLIKIAGFWFVNDLSGEK
jgi:hypothetical protein